MMEMLVYFIDNHKISNRFKRNGIALIRIFVENVQVKIYDTYFF